MMLGHSVSFAALGAALAFAAPAMAQQATADDHVSKPDAADTTPADGDILVTGTRILRPNIASAAPITTVTAQDIKAQSPTNIEEVLNRLPQIAPDSQQNYQDSDGRQRIKLRSLGFERTLVLIDGVRIGSATLGQTDLAAISLAQVERIEILKGPASVLYGRGAGGGDGRSQQDASQYCTLAMHRTQPRAQYQRIRLVTLIHDGSTWWLGPSPPGAGLVQSLAGLVPPMQRHPTASGCVPAREHFWKTRARNKPIRFDWLEAGR